MTHHNLIVFFCLTMLECFVSWDEHVQVYSVYKYTLNRWIPNSHTNRYQSCIKIQTNNNIIDTKSSSRANRMSASLPKDANFILDILVAKNVGKKTKGPLFTFHFGMCWYVTLRKDTKWYENPFWYPFVCTFRILQFTVYVFCCTVYILQQI